MGELIATAQPLRFTGCIMAANTSVSLWACCVCVLLLAAATDARRVGHAKATATHGIDDSQPQESVAALLEKAALLEEEQPVLEEEGVFSVKRMGLALGFGKKKTAEVAETKKTTPVNRNKIIAECYNNQDSDCWLTCVNRQLHKNHLEPISDSQKCGLHQRRTSIEEIMVLFDLSQPETRDEPGSTLESFEKECEAEDEVPCERGKKTDEGCTCFSNCPAQQKFLCTLEQKAQTKGMALKHDLLEYFAVNYCGAYVDAGHGSHKFDGEDYEDEMFCHCLAADACEKSAKYSGKKRDVYGW